MKPSRETTEQSLIHALSQLDAYRCVAEGEVVCHETHISWVFLVGDYAYKVKKPIRTDFLDYRRLQDRQRYCHEEVRLNSRYVKDLYLGVVPIAFANGRACVEGEGEPQEFAVKMRRFSDDALLDQQLAAGTVTHAEMLQLAETVAAVHASASQLRTNGSGPPQHILREAVDNLSELQPHLTKDIAEDLRSLQVWTRDTFEAYEQSFTERIEQGYVRECHGDLHLGNIVRWRGKYVPFDGIEFNDAFRWIDTLSDIAFLKMDLFAHQRADLSHLFINAYLEHTGDRDSLVLLRWYEVYRALVRAKVASLRATQLTRHHPEWSQAVSDRDEHIHLAKRISHVASPSLFITHGVSGSGKTTVTNQLIEKRGAIRVRSDVERKREVGLNPTTRCSSAQRQTLYSRSSTEATYAKMLLIAEAILKAGYRVVLDATYLKAVQRRAPQQLAKRLGVDFAIVDCQADVETLRQRITNRLVGNADASDADLQVLEHQLATREPLTDAERQLVVQV